MKVLILTDDLLFGSRLQALLADHDVELAATPRNDVGAIVADLTVHADRRLSSLTALGDGRPPTLGFYSHVETDVRDRARAAGVELIVPRSRIAREASELLAQLPS